MEYAIIILQLIVLLLDILCEERDDMKRMSKLWIWAALVMLLVLVIGIIMHNPLVICLAMFIFSFDGYNAWQCFKAWRKSKRGNKDD